MSEHRYLHSDWKDEVEFERQRIQAGVYDPVTIRRLEATGVTNGWKCLEAGAGIGSVAEWLSTRVGPTGKVVATDIELRFLRRLSAPNLDIRRHDILNDDIEENEYDLVHCRLVLMHLPEPEKGLRRMADAVRPGGWLVIEELDWGSSLSTDVTDPSTIFLTKTLRTIGDFNRRRGNADGFFGRRVRSLVEALGFADVGHEGWARTYRGGEPAMRPWSFNVQAGARPVIAEGLLTQEEVDKVQRLFMDPAFNWIGPAMFAAWGRKPVQSGRGEVGGDD